MFGDRISIKFRLEVASPLHIGAGNTLKPGEVPESLKFNHKRTGLDITPQVSAVVRDNEGSPYIPGTTIKGILRSLANGYIPELERQISQLFGSLDGAEQNRAQMAKCYFRNAYIVKDQIPQAESIALPHYTLQRATAILSRTKIDPRLGVAEDKKLFSMEVVPPGAVFEARLLLFPEQGEGEYLKILGTLFSILARDDGVSFGRNQRSGLGRLRLVDPGGIEISAQCLTEQGELQNNEEVASSAKNELQNSTVADKRIRRTLHLHCNGPFVVIGERQKSTDNEAQLLPLKLTPGCSWLPGMSLLGVLRSECVWMLKRKELSEGGEPRNISDGCETTYREDRDGNPADTLSPLERLFGVTGWKGLLHVVYVKLSNDPEEIDLTSVRLDRFSGAPIDGALFKTKAVLNSEFEVCLALDNRVESDGDVQRLFSELLEYVKQNGLTLGHGGNKGFGWFLVSEKPDRKNGVDHNVAT